MKIPAWLRKLRPHQRRAILETTALACIAMGLWMLSPPAALIVMGSLVLAASTFGGLRR